MSIPDPYANEPTAEVDRDHYLAWVKAKDAAARWHKEADRIEQLLKKSLADAHAGTLNGVKVLTNRPQKNYAAAAIRRDYPDLAQHFLQRVVKEEFQVDDFAAAHPDIAEAYRIRSFRMVVGANDNTV